MADITLVKISALPAAEQIGAEDLLPVVQEGATKAVAYGVIKDDIANELAPDATLSEAGKAADAKAVGDALALKADKTELTAEVSRIDAALNTKVNNTTYTAEVERIDGAIATKADAAATTAALATKANANDVTEALALKADAASVNAALATKANTTTVNAALALKADKTELTAGLATKQNVLTFDATPTEDSVNPVTSGGVYTATDAIEKGLANAADYVNLTSLKEQINTPGSVYYADGQNANAASAISAYSRSDFIRVAPGCVIRFSEVRQYDTYCVVAFYDDTKTYVQSKSVPGTGRNHHNGSVEIDAFGYVRLSCRNVELANATFAIITKDGEEIAEVKDASEEAFNDLLSGAVWEIGSINASGVDQDSTVRVRCDYIPVDVSIVKFDITDGYRFAAVWYNEIKGFLRDDYWNANPITLTPPEGTKYLRLVVSKVTEEEATVDYGNEVSADGVRFKTKPLYALTNELPDIWESYLDTKTTEIKTALMSLGSTGVAFTFVTDVHVAQNNMLTPVIMKRLENICPVNYHINGGDYIWSERTDSAMTGINDLCFWNESLGNLVEFPLRGNHDTNNYDGENSQNAITESQFYAIMTRKIERLTNTDGKTYYCIDNDSQKVRLICLDTSLIGTEFTAEMAWMQAKLTEKDATWTVIIVQHYLWGSSTSALHNSGQAVINAVNEVYANINATFIGILAGHTHVDYNSTESTNGYLLIARDANIVKGNTGTAALSFDYVTINTDAKTINFKKIGRGEDLSLSY